MTELASQILPTSIESGVRTSFIDYAMSVIILRALPNVRDGLQPVHRRILFAMYSEDLHPFCAHAREVEDLSG